MIPISYSLRSLKVRKTNTIASAAGLALVVFIFATVLMLAEGIKKALGTSGRNDTAILLRKGSDAELSSGIDLEDMAIIAASEGIAKAPDGVSLALGEVVVVLAQPIASKPNLVSNVTVRGVPPNAFQFRSEARIVAGRAARPGTDEAVVGEKIRGRFGGMDLGQSFELRKNRPVQVVGIFTTRGSTYESEVWADIDAVRSAFGRQGLASAMRVRLESADQFDAFKSRMESDRRMKVDVLRESTYFEKQSEGLALFLTVMGMIIAVMFSAGAIIGAMITMYAAVDHRKREVGTLLAIGFSRFNVLGAFLVESIFLATVGGGIGALLALLMRFAKFSTMNMRSWSEITVSFQPTPGIILGSLLFAVIMGVIGGLLPAIRAARLPLIAALRE